MDKDGKYIVTQFLRQPRYETLMELFKQVVVSDYIKMTEDISLVKDTVQYYYTGEGYDDLGDKASTLLDDILYTGVVNNYLTLYDLNVYDDLVYIEGIGKKVHTIVNYLHDKGDLNQDYLDDYYQHYLTNEQVLQEDPIAILNLHLYQMMYYEYFKYHVKPIPIPIPLPEQLTYRDILRVRMMIKTLDNYRQTHPHDFIHRDYYAQLSHDIKQRVIPKT